MAKKIEEVVVDDTTAIEEVVVDDTATERQDPGNKTRAFRG